MKNIYTLLVIISCVFCAHIHGMISLPVSQQRVPIPTIKRGLPTDGETTFTGNDSDNEETEDQDKKDKKEDDHDIKEAALDNNTILKTMFAGLKENLETINIMLKLGSNKITLDGIDQLRNTMTITIYPHSKTISLTSSNRTLILSFHGHPISTDPNDLKSLGFGEVVMKTSEKEKQKSHAKDDDDELGELDFEFEQE